MRPENSSSGLHSQRWMEGDTAFDHPRQLVAVPHLVHPNAVNADGHDFDSHFLKGIIFVSDRRHFRCSDECEVTGIEAHQNPFSNCSDV